MPNLEDLVPPLDLCYKRRIGDFAESVFVWNVRCSPDKIQLIPRSMWDRDGYICAAPTLAEILAKMAECPQRFNSVTCEADGTDFCVSAFVPYRGKPGSKLIEFRDTNAAAAALELWLYGLKGI